MKRSAIKLSTRWCIGRVCKPYYFKKCKLIKREYEIKKFRKINILSSGGIICSSPIQGFVCQLGTFNWIYDTAPPELPKPSPINKLQKK